MNIDGTTFILILLLILSLPHLFGALASKAPKIGRKSKTFRQFPTFSVQEREEEVIE